MTLLSIILSPYIEKIGAPNNKRKRLSVLKAVSLFPITLFIGVFSLVNFSFVAFASAALVIPYSLLGHPTENFILKNIQRLLLLAIHPLILLSIFSFYKAGDFSQILPLSNWILITYMDYKTLFFPFFTLFYLPLNMLNFASINS